MRHRLLLWCYWNKECNINKHSSLSFCVQEEEEDNVATHRHFLLWCYFSEEANGSLLPSPSFWWC